MSLGAHTISLDVTNTSDRDANEMVQLYPHQRYGTSSRLVREPKGFRRVKIAARRPAPSNTKSVPRSSATGPPPRVAT